jgi:GNAT superfamily N-acetyltransferase
VTQTPTSIAGRPAVPAPRRLEAADLPAALVLTQLQKWSHRLDDWELHFRLGRGWAIDDGNGTLLGTTLWWAYGEAFGTVGLVVVHPDAQGRGLGRRLMDAAIADAGPRTLRLAATEAGLELYRRCGFVEGYTIVQRQGPVSAAPAPALPPGVRLRAFEPGDLVAATALDAGAVGAPRDALIAEVARIATGGVVAEREGRLAGFALQRSSGRGTSLGPLVAEDESLAIALAAHLASRHTGFLRLDVPATATTLAAWLDASGLQAVDRVTVMTRGPAPRPTGTARTFGLVSQAFN